MRWTVVLLLLLAGCRGGPSSPADPPRRSAVPASPSATVMVSGHASYAERVKMPPGATLTVELLDAARPTSVRASVTMRDVAGPPIPFTLHAPAESVRGSSLRAVLRGPDGEAWFASRRPVPMASRWTGIELPLERLPDRQRRAMASVPTPSPAHWECGEYGVMSRFPPGREHALVDWNGYALRLPATPKGSGVQFRDAHGNAFRADGAEGFLTLAGHARRDCVRAARASPWNEALLRGALFRALGSEPGWFVEVSESPARLVATLDYADRSLDVPVQASPDGFVGSAADGPVRLRIRKETCTEGMSGQQFEAAVELETAKRAYRGCGAWLQR